MISKLNSHTAFELLLLNYQFQQVISQTQGPDWSSWSFPCRTRTTFSGWPAFCTSLILAPTLQLKQGQTDKNNTFFLNYTWINSHCKKGKRIKKKAKEKVKIQKYRQYKAKASPHPFTFPSLETITVISSLSPSRPFYALLGMQRNSSFAWLGSLYINGILWGFLGCSLFFLQSNLSSRPWISCRGFCRMALHSLFSCWWTLRLFPN